MKVAKMLSDEQFQELDDNWDRATPMQKLSWFNTIANRPGNWGVYKKELLELANYFANKQPGGRSSE